MLRKDHRQVDELRKVKFTRHYTKYAPGSVLIEFGDTKVLCTASIEDSVPRFLLHKNQGWLTAEYSMLPGSTHTRIKREAVVGKLNARSQEISRLIGRSLRSCIDLKLLGKRQITIDCDVLQADGGTRSASITGAFVALYDAVNFLLANEIIKVNPIKNFVAAISAGVVKSSALLDLDYAEDSSCDNDINFVLLDNNQIVEIQGSAEQNSFDKATLDALFSLASLGIEQLIQKQKEALAL